MKKRVLALILALLVVFAAGCSAAKAPAAADSAKTAASAPAASASESKPAEAAKPAAPKDPIRIGWWGSQIRHDATLKVLDMYTQKTGVKFEPEFFGFDDYIAKLNTEIAANDAPDIMQMGGNFPTYMDHIELLNPYIDNKMIDTSNTTKSFIAITTLDGKTVGLSLGTNATAMVYDPELFKKAGVPEPTKDWTWKEYEDYAMKIHEKLGIFGSSQTASNEFNVLTSWIQQYDNNGESLFLEPYRLKLNYTKDDYIIDFLNMKYRLTKAGAYPNPAQMAEIKDIEADPIVKGQSAMTWAPSNQYVALTKATKRSLALALPPRHHAGGTLANSIISSQMFSLYNKSKVKEEAVKFMSYFVNDIEANKVLAGERGVPIMKPVRDALSANVAPEQKAIFDYLTLVGNESPTEISINSPVQTEIRDTFTRLSEEVVFDKTKPADAARKFKAEAQAILDRAAKK